jgi:hypothetical protein
MKDSKSKSSVVHVLIESEISMEIVLMISFRKRLNQCIKFD